MSRLKEIHEDLSLRGLNEKDIEYFDSHTTFIAQEIAMYAHRMQKREDGDDYFTHPLNCLKKYQTLVGIVEKDYNSFDIDLMIDNYVPFRGVQELCLLHDVVEDSDFTLEDIEEIFDECNFGEFFDTYIKTPLDLITHRKDEPYDDYIYKCMGHPNSALVKMIDLQDNLNILSLVSLDNAKYYRAQRYLAYIMVIESQYQFLNKVTKYRKEYNLKRKGRNNMKYDEALKQCTKENDVVAILLLDGEAKFVKITIGDRKSIEQYLIKSDGQALPIAVNGQKFYCIMSDVNKSALLFRAGNDNKSYSSVYKDDLKIAGYVDTLL